MSDIPRWSTTAPLPLQAGAVSALAEVEAHDALLPGTRLDEFEIVRVLGAGGFGIVYLALDHVLLRHVAIKEYMPTALAGRGRGAMVSVRSATLAQTWPDTYGGMDATKLAGLLRAQGLAVKQTKIGGINRAGIARAAIERELAAR